MCKKLLICINLTTYRLDVSYICKSFFLLSAKENLGDELGAIVRETSREADEVHANSETSALSHALSDRRREKIEDCESCGSDEPYDDDLVSERLSARHVKRSKSDHKSLEKVLEYANQ